MRNLSRREFLAAAATPVIAAACSGVTEPSADIGPGRLRLQRRSPSRGTVTGTDVLYGGNLSRRAYLRVPPTYHPSVAAPLIIAFHGTEGRGDNMAAAFGSRTDALGAIVLAPDSISPTWDAVEGDFGGDIWFINEALDQTFDRCNIDTSRIALLGFSDGGSYVITLGITNGDQLAGVVSFSPGFFEVDHPNGNPDFFIAHGVNDAVLAIDDTSRKIVPELRARGCDVTYVEFDGGHVVTSAVADQAISWLGPRF